MGQHLLAVSFCVLNCYALFIAKSIKWEKKKKNQTERPQRRYVSKKGNTAGTAAPLGHTAKSLLIASPALRKEALLTAAGAG